MPSEVGTGQLAGNVWSCAVLYPTCTTYSDFLAHTTRRRHDSTRFTLCGSQSGKEVSVRSADSHCEFTKRPASPLKLFGTSRSTSRSYMFYMYMDKTQHWRPIRALAQYSGSSRALLRAHNAHHTETHLDVALSCSAVSGPSSHYGIFWSLVHVIWTGTTSGGC
jgi:hypothetical protein